MGAQSEDSNTISTPIVEEAPKPIITVALTEKSKEPTPELLPEKINKSEEESHTPPLPPELKMKLNEQQKKGLKNKNKDNNNWDMFAEQDTFKNDCNVSFNFFSV